MSNFTPDKPAQKPAENQAKPGNWGPSLFLVTLAVVLVFFWWLLIYSGGVEVHHG